MEDLNDDFIQVIRKEFRESVENKKAAKLMLLGFYAPIITPFYIGSIIECLKGDFIGGNLLFSTALSLTELIYKQTSAIREACKT